jgi:hypothetical protein
MVRTATKGIDPAGSLQTSVGTTQAHAQKSVLGLKLLISLPADIKVPIGCGTEQFLTDRIHCFDMNRFHGDQFSQIVYE